MTNKKGFTLIELLAVIVIMAFLLAIAVPSVITISAKIKTNMYCTKIGILEGNAVIWGQDNMNSLPTTASDHTSVGFNLVLQTLVDEGYVKKDDVVNGKVLDPRDNTVDLNGLQIKVYIKNKRVYAKIPDAIDTCK